MSNSDLKNLKKLADACRKAGIKHFKNADIEFTLSDDAPVSNYKKKIATASVESVRTSNDFIPTQDILTDEELLFYSSEGYLNSDNKEA